MTPRKITKRRHAKERNNEKTPRKMTRRQKRDNYRCRFFCVALFRLFVSNSVILSCVWRLFVILRGVFSLFRHFAWRLFVFLSFRVAFFRYFVISCCVISSFRLFAWRYFVNSLFCVALFRGKKTKRRNGTNQPPYQPAPVYRLEIFVIDNFNV